MSDEARMTFTEHLAELRTRIIRSGVAVAVAFMAAYAFSDQLFTVLSWPLRDLQEPSIVAEKVSGASPADASEPSPAPLQSDPKPKAQWTVLNPLEPFMVKLKLSAYAGLILALPFIIYQACAFIFPGMTPNERRMAQFFLVGSTMFAIFGVAVAYFGVFPLALPYLMEWAPKKVQILLGMRETVSIILKGLMGFAIAFQFPMVAMVLVYFGLITPDTLKRFRRLAIVILAVMAGVLTPPDPISMTIMLIPLIILYEMSIWLSYIVVRHARKGTVS